jgi:histidine ammonia-lyase
MTALRIGDEPLTPAALAAAARDASLRVEFSPAARARIAAAAVEAKEIAARQPVYGRTTGVGAQRTVTLKAGDAEHSLRLLRSHAGGLGEPLPEEVVRGTIIARLAQMARGGGGHRAELTDALAALVTSGELPVIRDLGGIGTGDLAVLGQIGLALRTKTSDVFVASASPATRTSDGFVDGDGFALMSSNAATVAVGALAWTELRELLDAGLGVAAASFDALRGNPEAYSEAVAEGKPLPGAVAVSATLRILTSGAAVPARLQDPFALRCVPQVGGALHDALAHLHDVLAIELNAAAENPLLAHGRFHHHGSFHAASIALALDTLRLAVVPFAQLSTARLAHLMDPPLTDLPAFLAAGAPGSSGLMIAEYVAADALARLRAEAAPATLGTATISRALEDHASFAWQGALQARRAATHLRTILALELMAAERASTMRRGDLAGLEDREIGPDAERAAARLPAVARSVSALSRP